MLDNSLQDSIDRRRAGITRISFSNGVCWPSEPLVVFADQAGEVRRSRAWPNRRLSELDSLVWRFLPAKRLG